MLRPRQIIICAILAVTPFLGRTALGRSKEETAEKIRQKVVSEQAYKFGEEYSFSLKDEQAILLRCSENPDGFDSVLICLTADFLPDTISDSGRRKTLYILLLRGAKTIGGGSSLPNNIGTIRGVGKAAAIAKWSANDGQISGSFLLTDNKQILSDKFMDLVTNGRISFAGNWQECIDFDSMRWTPDGQVEHFVRLWTEIKYNFANFDLVPELDWDKVLTEYLPQVRREQTFREYSRLLAECVSRLKDGHTDVSTRLCYLFDAAQPALRIEPVEGKAVLTEIGKSQEFIEEGLRRGDEIIHIDGRKVRDVLEEDIYPYIFASTPQDRDLKAFAYLLRGPKGTEVVLRIRDLEGKERDVKLTRKLNWDREISSEKSDLVEYQDLGDGIAYVAINTFSSNQVVEKFEQNIEKIRTASGLVIDVRENNGGNSSYGQAIISHLIEKPIPGTRWKTPQHIAAFKAWGRPKDWFEGEPQTIKPRKGEKYTGLLVILIGPKTVSAGEDFVIPLHASKRATIVGEKTAGTSGQPLQFNFSYIIRGQVCTKRDTYPDGREFVGVGIIPDVVVHPTRADIAAGRDVVLEKGIEVLREKIN